MRKCNQTRNLLTPEQCDTIAKSNSRLKGGTYGSRMPVSLRCVVSPPQQMSADSPPPPGTGVLELAAINVNHSQGNSKAGTLNLGKMRARCMKQHTFFRTSHYFYQLKTNPIHVLSVITYYN